MRKAGEELRAEIVTAAGASQVVLPPATLMPVASIGHVIERLRGGVASFAALAFNAEVIADAFRVDITRLKSGTIRRRRPADKPVAIAGRYWPVAMSFSRGRDRQQKPLFTLSAQLFESGVLDRVTVETGMVTVTADLQALEMRKPPSCAGHGL